MDVEKKSKTSYAKYFPNVIKEMQEWGDIRQRLATNQTSLVSYFFNITTYPADTGNILFAFAVTGQVLRWVSQPSWYYTLPAVGLLVAWIPLSTGSYGMAGVGMLTASWLLCRAQHAPERLGYGVLWALMVLLMNMHNVSESAAGLAIALLTLIVCSSAGERVKRFWPRHFFVMFYAVHLAVLGIVISM